MFKNVINAMIKKKLVIKQDGGYMKLDQKDIELIKKAQEAISRNYDDQNYNHTVGAAVRCENGEIFIGVNVYSIHGACAEQVAIGSAITHGKREFVSIVAVRGKSGEEIIPPCGSCRQMLVDYACNCEVIVSLDNKVTASDLIPFAYKTEA